MSVSPKQDEDEQRSKQDEQKGFEKPRDDETEADFLNRIQPDGRPFSDLHLRSRGYILKETYNYRGFWRGQNIVVYQSLRYEHEYVPGEKTFIQRRPGTEDDYSANPENVKNWVYGQGAVKIPYRWPDIVANPDALVFICEGEKDADRLASMGLIATTVAGQKWSEVAAAALKGRDTAVLEDNDAAGMANATAAAEILTPHAKSIRIVRLPELPHSGDVSNWLDAGHSKEDLLAEAAAAEPYGVNLFNVVCLEGKEVPIQKWFLEDRIPANSVSLLSGEGAAGKSLLMLQLCAAVPISLTWMNAVPATGPALFIDCEDGKDVIHRRLQLIREHYNVSYKYLGESGLHIASWAGDDSVLATTKGKSGKIITTARYHELLRLAREMRPSLISIASSANVFAGNELDRSQVQQFIMMLHRIAISADGTVILVSHPSLTGITSGSGLSGSTQWHNAVRSRFYLKGKSDGKDSEPKGRLRELEFMKNNYGPDSENIVIKYESGVFVPVEGATMDEAERQQRAEEIYLEVLQLLIAQNQPPGPKQKGSNYAPRMISQHDRASGFSLSDMVRAQQRLLDAHKIEIVTEGSPSRRYEYIRPCGKDF